MKVNWKRVLLAIIGVALFVAIAWGSYAVFSRALSKSSHKRATAESSGVDPVSMDSLSAEQVTQSRQSRRQAARSRLAARLAARFKPTTSTMMLAIAPPVPVQSEESIMEQLAKHAVDSRAAHARARFGRRARQRKDEDAEEEQSKSIKSSVEHDEDESEAPKKQVNPAGPLPKPDDDSPVSIVIVSTNEVLLAKTVESILAAQSADMINEILIIDDFSDKPVTYAELPSEKRLHIVRARERLGLIRARMAGGEIARGPFMVLIDAHTKPYDNWLKPIVKLLRQDHRRLLNMEVGLLDAKTWKQIQPEAMGRKAGFTYNLHHFWEPERTAQQLSDLAGEEVTDLDESPITMGMFATSKRWWKTIGGMDIGMETWGAENIEISLKTWLCGGDIRVARGARIDHTFRDKQPYQMDTDAWQRNLARVAETWLDDETRAKFYETSGKQRGQIHIGNLDNIHRLQRRLTCKPFKWYLEKFRGRSPVAKAP